MFKLYLIHLYISLSGVLCDLNFVIQYEPYYMVLYEYKLYTMMSWNDSNTLSIGQIAIPVWLKINSAWTVLNIISSDYTTIPICYFSPVRRATVRMLRCILMNLPYLILNMCFSTLKTLALQIRSNDMFHRNTLDPFDLFLSKKIKYWELFGVCCAFCRFIRRYFWCYWSFQYNWHSKILENGAN